MSLRITLRSLAAGAGFVLAGLSSAAFAAPVDVNYSVTGSTGNWTLDFTVTNNLLGTTQDIYFFGVDLSARDIVGSPTGFDPNQWSSWNNAGFGGSSNVYDNNWIDFSFGHLAPGASLGGFAVHSTDAVAPTSVAWFAYGYGSSYQGGGNFNHAGNPGFEGIATTTQAVPEPETYALMLAGLVAIGAMGNRRRNKA